MALLSKAGEAVTIWTCSPSAAFPAGCNLLLIDDHWVAARFASRHTGGRKKPAVITSRDRAEGADVPLAKYELLIGMGYHFAGLPASILFGP